MKLENNIVISYSQAITGTIAQIPMKGYWLLYHQEYICCQREFHSNRAIAQHIRRKH